MNLNRYAVVFMGILLLTIALPTNAQEGDTQLYGGASEMGEVLLRQQGVSGIGLTLIEGDPFFRFQLQPEVDLGKIGIGLDLVLLYNPYPEEHEDGTMDAQFLAEDGEEWDNLSTIIRTIRYLRYGGLNEPLYARFGELDYVTIGHGFIMSGYANHDRRGLRVNVSSGTGNVGLETVVNNLADPTIFGGRAYLRPLQGTGMLSILERLEFGATYLTDIKPDLLPDDEKDDKTINEEPLIALGADIAFPLIETNRFQLLLYDDLAVLNTKQIANPDETERAMGNAVGVGLSIPKALFKAEYRTFGEGFIPTVFDYTYEAASTDFLGMEEDASGDEAIRGYFSMLAVNPIPKVDLMATFQDYSNSEPRLYAGITESGLVERMSFRAFYTKRDIGLPYLEELGNPNSVKDPGFVEDLFRLDEKSAFTVRIGYELFASFEVAVLQEYRFHQVEKEDGEMGFEPIKKTSVEAGFRLQFE